jgi:hypothetical protein
MTFKRLFTTNHPLLDTSMFRGPKSISDISFHESPRPESRYPSSHSRWIITCGYFALCSDLPQIVHNRHTASLSPHQASGATRDCIFRRISQISSGNGFTNVDPFIGSGYRGVHCRRIYMCLRAALSRQMKSLDAQAKCLDVLNVCSICSVDSTIYVVLSSSTQDSSRLKSLELSQTAFHICRRSVCPAQTQEPSSCLESTVCWIRYSFPSFAIALTLQ